MKPSLQEFWILRVYCVVSDGAGEQPLHEAIVHAARHAGLAGASVLAAKMGFGQHEFYSELLSEGFADRQPIVVEIADEPQRLADFLPSLQSLVRARRLITLQRAQRVCNVPR